MKYTIPDCIGKLTNHKFNAFEFIINHQYKKFKVFYDLLRSFNDNIEKFTYIFVNQDILCIDVTFNSLVNPEDVMDKIQSFVDPSDEGPIVEAYGEIQDQRVIMKLVCNEKNPFPNEYTEDDNPFISNKSEDDNTTKQ